MDESQADALLERLARDVKLLFELELLEPPTLARPVVIDSVVSAEAAARDLRKRLALGPGPVWGLLAVVERAGLFGFCLDLRDESLDGSYLRLDAGGVAVVNGMARRIGEGADSSTTSRNSVSGKLRRYPSFIRAPARA